MAPAPTEKMFLVLTHKVKNAEERALIPNGASILDEEQLVMVISGNPDITTITKAIKPGSTSIDIFKVDLVPEDKKEAYAKATKKGGPEECPWKEFLGHNWEGHSFDEVTMLVGEEAVEKVLKAAGVGTMGEAAKM